MTQVWRLHVRPDEAREGTDPTRFCIERGVLGVAWGGLDSEVPGAMTAEQYAQLARSEGYGTGKLHGWTAVFNALADRMETNDLCWTRDATGVYYLGRVDGGVAHCALHTGGWHYYAHDPQFKNSDLNQGRSCRWVRVGSCASVAGVIRNQFIRGQAVRKIGDSTAVVFSQFIYNRLADDFKYELSRGVTSLWALLSPDDSEDLVGAWLQLTRDYYVVPSTSKVGTPICEYELVHRRTGERAFVQVKNGSVDLNQDDYTDLLREGNVFLLTTGGSYTGNSQDRLFCLKPEELAEFARDNRGKLPANIEKWLELIDCLPAGRYP